MPTSQFVNRNVPVLQTELNKPYEMIIAITGNMLIVLDNLMSNLMTISYLKYYFKKL